MNMISCPGCDRHVQVEPDVVMMKCPFCGAELQFEAETTDRQKRVMTILGVTVIGVAVFVIAVKYLDKPTQPKYSPAYGDGVTTDVKF